MKIQDIKQIIAKLNLQGLVRFRFWFERDARFDELEKLTNREHILSLRGKYKGKGLMKALIADKQHERDDMT